ncbi:MAG: hypothetical protein ACYC5Y_04090 [Symbiobacteriia bacterium]
MKQFLSTLLTRVALRLLKSYRRVSLDLLRIEVAGWYVRGVGAARQLFISGLAMAFLVALAVVGFLLMHLGLYALLPAPANAVALLALGALYLIVAILGLRWACSEKTWMKYSKAAHYVELAARKDPPAKS